MPTLYITEPGAMLEKEAGQLLVTLRGEVLLAAPAIRVDQVVIVGSAGVTTPALMLLVERGIGLVMLSGSGAFRGRLQTFRPGHLDVRRQQFRREEDERFCLEISRAIIAGKIHNSRSLLMRLDKTNTDPIAQRSVAAMRATIDHLGSATTRAELMGFEGDAAREAFKAMRSFIRPPWVFPTRARRPPPDPVNALLSLLYTLLYENCHTALQVVGLDPECGILHRSAPGRASLALDLMEAFRPVLAESVALTLLNKRMLAPDDFEPSPDGGVQLTRRGWQVVAPMYAKRLQTRVRPADTPRAISYQKVLELEARALKRAIMDGVPFVPFRTR
jgi:CRISPR-associated protein Cas1